MHEFVTTEDGSLTLRVPELDEHYHSVHGAIQEARHIFLRAGIDHYRDRLQQNHAEPLPLHILEAGFGTGLNAYLTLLHAEEIQVPVCYHSLEKYPLPPEETTRLNYPALLGRPQDPLFRALHDAPWEETVEVTPRFLLHKHFCDFREIDFPSRFDIIFFDAEDYGTPEFVQEYKPDTWCLGSQFWAKNPHVPNYNADFGILLDMVGSKGATFYKEYTSMRYAARYVDKVWDTARNLGYGKFFINADGGAITDDHQYVIAGRNIPCLDIINTNPEAEHGFGSYWHTVNDNMQIIDRETLKAVGQTIMEVIYNY